MLKPEDRETFDEYRGVMGELHDTEIAKNGASYSITLGSPDRSANKLPSETALRDLFTAFRHLWLEKEPANFLKVCKRLRRSGLLTHEETEALEAARRHWRERCVWTGGIRINLGARMLTSREYIDMYFNSLYFHRRDKAKRAMRDRLEANIGPLLGRAWLLDMVSELVWAASGVERIVAGVLARDQPSQMLRAAE